MTSIAIDRNDGLSSATAIKGPVKVATTANISLTGLQTIDGVTVASGDRVLVKDQTTASQNGIYVVDTGPWRRAKDFAGNRDVKTGTQVYVTHGTLYASSGWYVSTDTDPIVIGTTNIVFTQNVLLNAAQLIALEAAAEASADAAAASEANASTDAGRAEGARDAAIAAASSVIAPKATVAQAIADAPDVDPEYYEIAYYDTTYQTGSGAKWRKVASDPSLVAGAAFQNANGAWYVNDAATLRPEQFGRCGVDATGDTAAWAALASAANARARVRIVAEGAYEIAGSTVAFNNIARINLRLTNAEFYQQTTFSKTISFDGCDDVRVHGGYFEGLGGGSGEYDGASSSYNGVAAIFFLNCEKVWVSKCDERFHAGGGFVVQGGRVRRFENVSCEGIGYPYIDPIGQDNQGNGSDFGIMCQPSVNDETQIFLFEDRFINCRVFNHAFGLQAVATKSLFVRGCEIGPCPGQHCIYSIDCDGISVGSNIFRGSRQIGYKLQYENYAGLYYGPVWAATTAYAVGATVRAFSTLYVCKTAHTSGASFSATNWNIHPLMFRWGGVINDNSFNDCGIAIGFISTDSSDGRYIFSRGVEIKDNTVQNCLAESFYLDRMIDCSISDNTIIGGASNGMQLRDFGGTVKGNTFINVALNGILAYLSKDTKVQDNRFIDCGLLGTDDQTKTPTLVSVARTANTIPDMPANPKLFWHDNSVEWTGSAATGAYILFSADSAVNVAIKTFTGVQSEIKYIRVAGSVLRFDGSDYRFYAGAQNSPSTPIAGRGMRQYYGTAIPTGSGIAYVPGDIVWNSNVIAGGTLGWVCTTAGAPGTWKAISGIAA